MTDPIVRTVVYEIPFETNPGSKRAWTLIISRECDCPFAVLELRWGDNDYASYEREEPWETVAKMLKELAENQTPPTDPTLIDIDSDF